MKKLLVYIGLLLFVGNLTVLGQDNNAKKVVKLAEDIKTKMGQQTTDAAKLDYSLYLQLVTPFVYEDSVPTHFKKYLNITENNRSWIIQKWDDDNVHSLTDLQMDRTLDVMVEASNHENLLNHVDIKTTGYVQKVIHWHNDFKELTDLIVNAKDSILKENSEAYNKALEENVERYRNKYLRGYRQRNLVTYFTEGYLERRRTNRREDRGKEKGLLEPPTRTAFTLVAPPIIFVTTNSLMRGEQTKGEFMTGIQGLGVDYYVDDKFKHYVGVSAFWAVPFNSDFGLWDGSFFGGEIHWNNKFNLGIGRSLKRIDSNDGKSDFAVKIFVSVALFDKLFKEKEN